MEERKAKRTIDAATIIAPKHKAIILIFFQGSFLKSMFVNLARKAIIKLNKRVRLCSKILGRLLFVKTFQALVNVLRSKLLLCRQNLGLLA